MLSVDVQSGIGFRIATNFKREIGRNRRYAFLLGTRIPQRVAVWKSGWER